MHTRKGWDKPAAPARLFLRRTITTYRPLTRIALLPQEESVLTEALLGGYLIPFHFYPCLTSRQSPVNRHVS